MKRLIIAMLYVLLPMFVVAQQERSFQIDEKSFEPEQKGGLGPMPIDKIAHDYSNRPCARIKLHINRMSQEDISSVSVKTVGGNVVIMKSEVATEGNGLIIELTARPNVRLYLHHDKYGDSNEVTLNLEADKVYKLEAQLSLQYSIAVNTNFVGADVYIDGNYKGKTDASFGLTINDIPSGLHTLRVVYGTAYNEKQIEVSSTNIYFRIELNTTTSLPQYVVFEVEPKEAIVVIDHKSYVPDSEGIVTIRLNNGSYEYQISAKDYHPEKGVFMVEGAKVKRRVTLKPAFGYVSIEASPIVDGANVYIDDNFVGRAPLKSDKLSSGAHRIKIIKELYLPVEESIVISDNEVLEYKPTLTADFAVVSLSVEGGADIYVNDSYKGNSTWRGNLATGTYVFEARKAGHRPTQLNQEIRATATTQSYTLVAPTPILGTLDIQSTPSNAAVYVDGQHVGDTPLSIDIIIGNHKVSLKKTGYTGKSEYVTILEGEVRPLKLVLSKTSTTASDDGKSRPKGKKSKSIIKRSCFYFSGEYQFIGLSGIKGSIGGFIKNINIEGDFIYSFNKSETIYWNFLDTMTKPYGYSYRPMYYGGRFGYGFIIGKRLRITPQIGGGILDIRGRVVEYGLYDPEAYFCYCVTGVAGLRVDFAVTPFMAISLMPNYNIPVVKSNLYDRLLSALPTLDDCASGFALSAGICFFF